MEKVAGMDGRIDEFIDALSMMTAALRLLQEGDCPFDVAAHLDFAAHRLGDHLGVEGHKAGGALYNGPSTWLN